MSKIYAIIGGSAMTVVADTVDYRPQENEILMKSERPEGNYIASADGTWVLNAPSTEEKLEVLDTKYNADKNELMSAYLNALVYGNTDLADEIKADIARLDEAYDTDYEEIVGGADNE